MYVMSCLVPTQMINEHGMFTGVSWKYTTYNIWLLISFWYFSVYCAYYVDGWAVLPDYTCTVCVHGFYTYQLPSGYTYCQASYNHTLSWLNPRIHVYLYLSYNISVTMYITDSMYCMLRCKHVKWMATEWPYACFPLNINSLSPTACLSVTLFGRPEH